MRIKELKKGYEKLTERKARIVAHSIGDGYIGISKHDYNIKYEVSDPELIDSFKKDLIEVYGLKVTDGFNKSGKTDKMLPFVRLRSKLAYEDLQRFASYYSSDWKIKKPILRAKKYIKREFLKALFDDEGSVIPIGKGGLVRLYSINKKGLEQIIFLLKEFKIESFLVSGFGLRRNVYGLTIKDLKLFLKEIGFNLKRKQRKLEKIVYYFLVTTK